MFTLNVQEKEKGEPFQGEEALLYVVTTEVEPKLILEAIHIGG